MFVTLLNCCTGSFCFTIETKQRQRRTSHNLTLVSLIGCSLILFRLKQLGNASIIILLVGILHAALIKIGNIGIINRMMGLGIVNNGPLKIHLLLVDLLNTLVDTNNVLRNLLDLLDGFLGNTSRNRSILIQS